MSREGWVVRLPAAWWLCLGSRSRWAMVPAAAPSPLRSRRTAAAPEGRPYVGRSAPLAPLRRQPVPRAGVVCRLLTASDLAENESVRRFGYCLLPDCAGRTYAAFAPSGVALGVSHVHVDGALATPSPATPGSRFSRASWRTWPLEGWSCSSCCRAGCGSPKAPGCSRTSSASCPATYFGLIRWMARVSTEALTEIGVAHDLRRAVVQRRRPMRSRVCRVSRSMSSSSARGGLPSPSQHAGFVRFSVG